MPAGRNTVTEAPAVGLPAVYVPLPIGNGEQRLNARPVVDAGGGLLVDDAALHARWVGDRAAAAHRHRPAGGDVGGRRRSAADADDAGRLVLIAVLRGSRSEPKASR